MNYDATQWNVYCTGGSVVIISPQGRVFKVDCESCGQELESRSDIEGWLKRAQEGSLEHLGHPSRFFRDWGKRHLIRSARLSGNYNELVALVVDAGFPSGMWPTWGEDAPSK